MPQIKMELGRAHSILSGSIFKNIHLDLQWNIHLGLSLLLSTSVRDIIFGYTPVLVVMEGWWVSWLLPSWVKFL